MRKLSGIIAIVAIMVLLISCGNNSKQVINRTGTDTNINFEFENLQGTTDRTLDLNDGDIIETKIDIKSGELAIKVEGEDKEIPYEGNDVKSGEFSFKIQGKGKYTFTLTGKKADGNVSFNRKSADSSKETKDSKELKTKVNEDNKDKKNIVIEGLKQESETITSKLGYTISYDKNEFKYTSSGDSDSFMATNLDSNTYPNIFLAISKVNQYTVDETMKGLILQSGQDGTPEEIAIGKEKYKAEKFAFKEGNSSNSKVCEYYVTEKNNQVYLIEINYYIEVEEAYGSRLHSMLDSLVLN